MIPDIHKRSPKNSNVVPDVPQRGCFQETGRTLMAIVFAVCDDQPGHAGLATAGCNGDSQQTDSNPRHINFAESL
jgi:hypothetical protein